MTSKMKTFKSYLTEARNTDVADVNEILLGYYLAGENWGLFDDSSSVKKQLELKKSKITDRQVEEQEDRASRMSSKTLSWARKNGYSGIPAKIFWTARKGSLQRAVGNQGKVDKGNPTDVLIQFTDGKFLGISAKSTLKNAEIGFKNPGMGTVERNLGIELASIKKEAEEQFIIKYDLPKSASSRKKVIRSEGYKQEADAEGSKVMSKMRDILLSKLKTMSDDDSKQYLLSDWMDASDIVYPSYIKVTGKRSSVSIENPLSNSKIEYLNKGGITFEPVGNESIGVKSSGKKIMKMRFKYESQALSSSMKLSGDPW
jgi:hypothetical protein